MRLNDATTLYLPRDYPLPRTGHGEQTDSTRTLTAIRRVKVGPLLSCRMCKEYLPSKATLGSSTCTPVQAGCQHLVPRNTSFVPTHAILRGSNREHALEAVALPSC